jgi:hypothetical protein
MSKFSSFADYPPRSLAGAEAALLTAWASLERFHDDLVLVGGLAVKYLTKQGAGGLPGHARGLRVRALQGCAVGREV